MITLNLTAKGMVQGRKSKVLERRHENPRGYGKPFRLYLDEG